LLLLGGVGAGAACGTHGSSSNQGTPGGDAGGGGSNGQDSGVGNVSPDAAIEDAGAAEDAPSGNDAGAVVVIPAACNGSVKTIADAGAAPPAAPALTVATGFKLETIAAVANARQLAALPNGDLLVATNGTSIYLIPNATAAGAAGAPIVFATVNDSPAQGITYVATTCTIYVAGHAGIYSAPYVDAQTSATFGSPIASVRTGAIAPNSDGDVHVTSSVGFTGGTVYAGVGSSCNACAEVDPTRAVILSMQPTGAGVATKATRIRNAIAMTTNPATGTLWAGGAGQDDLPLYHPYEFFDAVTLHAGTADYGWPDCEENHVGYVADAGCTNTVVPLIELPSYSTLIGAAFYPLAPTGASAFPAAYRGGVFIAAHGGWHQSNGLFVTPPRVVYVAMNGDLPVTPVDWTDAGAQWTEFVGGFQLADGTTRIGRPTGMTVGVDGSLFVADDQTGLVYRIRPE
jgi:glucose/arabinose dehydrogenase